LLVVPIVSLSQQFSQMTFWYPAGQSFMFSVFSIIFHYRCLVPVTVAIRCLHVVQGTSLLLPSLVY